MEREFRLKWRIRFCHIIKILQVLASKYIILKIKVLGSWPRNITTLQKITNLIKKFEGADMTKKIITTSRKKLGGSTHQCSYMVLKTTRLSFFGSPKKSVLNFTHHMNQTLLSPLKIFSREYINNNQSHHQHRDKHVNLDYCFITWLTLKLLFHHPVPVLLYKSDKNSAD